MKKSFKYMNILIIFLIILAGAVCFAVFRIKSSSDSPPSTTEEENSVEIYRPQAIGEKASEEPVIPTDYTLELKNEVLYFYLNSDGERVLLDASPINISLFPSSDIKALSESITVKTLEEGISIIEDFTS